MTEMAETDANWVSWLLPLALVVSVAACGRGGEGVSCEQGHCAESSPAASAPAASAAVLRQVVPSSYARPRRGTPPVVEPTPGPPPTFRYAGATPSRKPHDCSKATRNFCAELPHFKENAQVLDGNGEEFCNVPSMVYQVARMPWVNPSYSAGLPETVTVRVAWTEEALLAHVHVADPAVSPAADLEGLWAGDNVQFFVSGTSLLTGAYSGREDGGARHLIIAPPSTQAPNGFAREFYERGANTTRPILNRSVYATRVVKDGYEVEIRLPWAGDAAPRVVGSRIGFDFVVGASSKNFLELEGALANQAPLGGSSCTGQHHPGCDDRTWCTPTLTD